MQSISISDMDKVLDHVVFRHKEPVMFWGEPGLGKTDKVNAAVVKHDALLADVRLGQYDSVDLRGIPVPHAGQTVWHAPITLPFKGNPEFDTPENKGRPILLFLDELNSAQMSVQAVAMQLLNERRIGEHELMDEVCMCAAGNAENHRAVAQRMATTVANRLTHFEVLLDVEAWCYWAQSAGLPNEAIAFHLFAKGRPMLSTFKTKDGTPTTDKAFATPRTWEKALRYYADPEMPEDIKQAAMQGAIGQGPAAEFWGYVDVYQKIPSIESIIKGPDKVKVPEQANMRYAVAVAISSALTTKNVAPLNQYLLRMDPEFSIMAWQLVIRRDAALTGTREFIDFSKKFRTIFAR